MLFLFILNEFRDTRSGLDRNYWRLQDMCINEERINKLTVDENKLELTAQKGKIVTLELQF